jgi:hypothetical protein
MARNVKPTGPGQHMNFKSEVGVLGRLFNFDRDGHKLKFDHQEWLDKNVVPILLQGGSVTIRGFADSTASAAHNMELSRDRMNSVKEHLKPHIQNDLQIKQQDFVGKSAALAQTGDNVRDSFWRAVDITAWDRPAPPAPPQILPPEIKTEWRIIHRVFLTLKSSLDKSGQPGGPGDPSTAKALADLLKWLGLKMLSSKEDGEDIAARRTALVPVGHEVVHIEIAKQYTSGVFYGGDMELTQQSVDYSWAETTPTVVIHKKEHDEVVTGAFGSISKISESDHESTEQVTRAEARKDSFYTPPRP